jgi:hypothetical protein
MTSLVENDSHGRLIVRHLVRLRYRPLRIMPTESTRKTAKAFNGLKATMEHRQGARRLWLFLLRFGATHCIVMLLER